MKKIFAMFALLMLLLTLVPMALAESDTTGGMPIVNTTEDVNSSVSDNMTTDDETEIKIMTTPYGVEVRLNQLKLSIEKNIERGNAVIEEGNFTEENNILLNSILDDLSSLTNDIDSLDLNQNSSVLAEQYVAIKKQAITLSNHFKVTVHKEIAADKLDKVRMKVQEKTKRRVQELKEKLLEKKSDYEHKKAFDVAKRLGIKVDENATVDDVISEIKAKVDMMTPKQKEKAIKSYVKFKAKERVMTEDIKEKTKTHFRESYMDRELEMQKRIQRRIDNSTLSPKEREIMRKRITQVREDTRERVLDHVENRVENRRDVLEKMREQDSKNQQVDNKTDNETKEVDEE